MSTHSHHPSVNREQVTSSLEPYQAKLSELWVSTWQKGNGNKQETKNESKEFLLAATFSEMITQWCERQPAAFIELINSGDLQQSYTDSHYSDTLQNTLENVQNEAQLMEQLRKFRKREMVRIAWRDLLGHADLVETTRDLSLLADACTDLALQHLYCWHCELWGEPMDHSGNKQQLVVIGMGKLGAHELNYCSDIDLIFTYPEEGDTVGARRSIANQEFFIKLGQALIRVLDTNNAWGFVFRVDMRLRPFGESSPLAISFDAMEEYYQVHGREWERYAMVKARVIAGDLQAGEQLLKQLKPFVYRKYVDYGAFESLREMKAMISREVKRKGMEHNVKLGAGGIREVEFIAQAFQLIRGGREPLLQNRRLLFILEHLRKLELLPGYVVDELVEAYFFLRNTEHRLQEYAEQQTHLLPSDEQARLRLALSMGFSDWHGFHAQLSAYMNKVHDHFNQVFAAPQTEHAESDELDLVGVWQGNLDLEQANLALSQSGYKDTHEVYEKIQQLRKARAFVSMSATGRNRMNQLIPLLIGAGGRTEEPDLALTRTLTLLEAVGRRSAYLALLVENPMALSQLVRLCAASPWIANYMGRNPQLLDELLDPRSLYYPPDREELQAELQERLSGIEPEDVEAQLEMLRRIKQVHMLRVAAADVMDALPLMVVSDQLTDLAELMLQATQDLAWQHLVQRHGRPQGLSKQTGDKGFAVIAYGKMGGIELGYGSDLDIVFLHHSDLDGHSTDGEKSIDNPVFYARMAQRMIHILTTRTAAGELYEIDMRLRPSGNSGMLVSGTDAFAEYERQHAWTWEHQALVRARFVCGDAQVESLFNKVRTEILCRERDIEVLRTDVREMREKMRENLDKSSAGLFDIKQGQGGIADIEFMVQFHLLAHAHSHPQIIEFTDNIRQLLHLARYGLMEEVTANSLIAIYRSYRVRAHRLTLQDLPALCDAQEFVREREQVQSLWQGTMEPS